MEVVNQTILCFKLVLISSFTLALLTRIATAL